MFSENNVTKLIIVHTQATQKYAAYLMQLISLEDDKEGSIVGLKDGSVEAVLWNEKNYEDNRPTLPSSAHILFIGDSKLMKMESANMNLLFSRFGLNFYALGRRAVMNVDSRLLSKKEYDGFRAFAAEYGKKFKEKVKLNVVNDPISIVDSTADSIAKWIGFTLIFDICSVLIYGMISGKKAQRKINDQQYSFLTLLSYLELIPKFLEG